MKLAAVDHHLIGITPDEARSATTAFPGVSHACRCPEPDRVRRWHQRTDASRGRDDRALGPGRQADKWAMPEFIPPTLYYITKHAWLPRHHYRDKLGVQQCRCCKAAPGYDEATGLGSLNADLIAQRLHH
jgi:hypothetical protein